MIPHHSYMLCWTARKLAIIFILFRSHCFHYLIAEISHFGSFLCVLNI